MGLPMQREHSAYFGLQNVMESQVFNVHFEQNIEGKHQCVLMLVDGTGTTSPQGCIRTLVEKDVHRPLMKKWK